MKASIAVLNAVFIIIGLVGTIAFFYRKTLLYKRKSHDSRQHKNISITDPKEFLPALTKSGSMPNYFHGGRTHTGNQLFDSSLVFIHHPRSGGKNFIDCLNNISYSNDLSLSPLMTGENRLLWESRNSNSFGKKFQIHRGVHTMGMCQNLDHKCSYIMFIRDPLQRSISSHKHCTVSPNDEICGSRNAREISLRDWIISEGSVLLKHFLMSPTFCESNSHEKYNISLDVSKHISCWAKSNLILDSLIEQHKTYLTNFIVENLQKIISVIGLTEEFKMSLQMFESSFKLPFSKCSVENREQTRKEKELNSNRSFSENNVIAVANDNEFDEEDEDYNLSDDIDIQEALSSDYAIYKEAKRIFHIQKQFLLNSVR